MSLDRDPVRSAAPATNGEDRSSAELERDIDRIRSRMDQTINQIEHRLSPNRLIDQALQRMRGGPGAFANNLGRTVRKHPVPSAMFAAGLAWLLFAERGDKAGARAARYRKVRGSGRPYHLREASRWDVPAQAARERIEPIDRSIVHREGDKTMSGSWDQPRRSGWNLFHGRGSHGSSGGGYVESGREGLRQVGSAAQHQVERARTGFEHMLEEQPLVVGAVALALGAVLGATLPTSRIENRYMGPTRDQLQNRAGDYAREQWEKAKEVALSAGAAAMAEAEDQGVTPGSLYEQAKDKVTRVAGAATEAAKDEAQAQNLGGRGTSRS
jgi:uncharacterized protein DUF3618